MPSYSFTATGIGPSPRVLSESLEFDAPTLEAAMAHVDEEMVEVRKSIVRSLGLDWLRCDRVNVAARDADGKWHDLATIDADDIPSFRGYSRNELNAALKLVANTEHWKMPIDAALPVDDGIEATIARIDAAIEYSAGGHATFETVGEKVIVRAPGYWAVIGS